MRSDEQEAEDRHHQDQDAQLEPDPLRSAQDWTEYRPPHICEAILRPGATAGHGTVE